MDFEIDVINTRTHIRAQKAEKRAARNRFDTETTELAQIQSHGIMAIRMMKRFNFKLDTEEMGKRYGEREREIARETKQSNPFK